MKIIFNLILIFFITVPLSAENDSGSNVPALYKLPAIEVPYNFSNGYSFPGMNQSLHISAGVSKLTHQVLFDLFPDDNYCLGFAAVALWDFFLFTLPGGTAWLHEEWHRAVMGQYGIKSYNDIYNLDITAETIAVSHVKDSDLAYLKEKHNPDMVRLGAAGNEAEVEAAREYRGDSFFYGRPIRYELVQMWLSLINASLYVRMCSTSEADTYTDEMNQTEGADIQRRDFTGFDFTAWIYDLSRPDEPYSARGIHPSGVGIDRYIKRSDLTDDERKYLKKTGRLTMLNFVSPQMFGLERFTIEDNSITGSFQFNLMLLHHLTSFGNDIIFSFLFKKNILNLETSFHCYNNESDYFPGLEVALKRYPLTIFGREIYTGCRLMLFLQPEKQRFRTSSSEAGGLAGAAISIPIVKDAMEFYIECDAKSDGWVAGNVYLNQSFQARSGLLIHF